ncbi:hypothetical protein ElyMa_001828300 [Elysia marginata]|uniref:Uncharacterized protein n=1 Tax=Elysia marginata TaxID=1093978 RepID=A0AAV4EJQ2_9GAST|nr:hypothetical protein ElyMa_001828300 [Elysia marginata]
MPFNTTNTDLIRIALGPCAVGPSTLNAPLGGALPAAVSHPDHTLDKHTIIMYSELRNKVKETFHPTVNLSAEVNTSCQCLNYI